VVGSAAFVGWYNGHPEFADLDPPLDVEAAAVIGNGNVALDVARILSKTPAEFAGRTSSPTLSRARQSRDPHDPVLGRRGPHQIAMTPKELGELGHLEAAVPIVDLADFPPELDDALLEPGQRKSVTHSARLRALERGKRKRIDLRFLRQADARRGRGQGRAADRREDQLDERGAAVGTGETYESLRPGRHLHRLQDAADPGRAL
jgi:ferredoxin--NADP+ reductase